jgi:hypothetical protein
LGMGEYPEETLIVVSDGTVYSSDEWTGNIRKVSKP